MNIQLQSTANSALANLLNNNNETKKNVWPYGEENIQTHSRDLIRVEPLNTATLSNEISYHLPKVGLLRKAYVYFEITFTSGAADSNLKAGHYAINLLSNGGFCEIHSRNKTIARQDQNSLIMAVYRKDGRKCDNLLTMCGAADTSNTASGSTVTAKFYMPLCFYLTQEESDIRHCLNLSFLETISLRIKLCGDANLGAASGDVWTSSISKSQLICDIINLPQANMRQLVEANYSSGTLNMLNRNSYSETALTTSGTSHTFDLNSNNLIVRTYIQLIDAGSADDANGLEITDLTFEGSGRQLLQLRGAEMLYMNFGGIDVAAAAITKKVYVIDWSLLPSKRYMVSNALSLREISAPRFVVTSASAAANSTLRVCHEYLELISINSNDGSITTSIST